MPKLFLINGHGDPYEPDYTLAACTSIEAAKALGFKELWIEESFTENIGPMPSLGLTVYRDLISGKARVEIGESSTNRPAPLVQEIETDTLISPADYEPSYASDLNLDDQQLERVRNGERVRQVLKS